MRVRNLAGRLPAKLRVGQRPAGLRLRLFVLSLLVAVLAIAATAWLTTRQTSDRLRAEFVTTIEADSYVRRELMAFAQHNRDWDRVDDLIDTLAEQVGQRVLLTRPDGAVIADSAGGEVPPDPVARIDMAAAELALFGDSSTWRLTETEIEERGKLTQRALSCLHRLDPDAGITITGGEHLGAAPPPEIVPDQRVTVESGDTGGVGLSAAEGRLTEQMQKCIPDGLSKPSAAGAKRDATFAAERKACLKRNDLPVDAEITVPAGIEALALPLGGAAPTPVLEHGWSIAENGTTEGSVAHCDAVAMRKAVAPLVPEPALLYTGSSDRFDPLSDGGWQPTALAGLTVLALAAGLTLLVGRRLTRPIEALTVAARRMGAGDRDARVPVAGRDEVAELGTAFNAMADSIEGGERQRKAMITDVAHELRTPLANVLGYLEAAEDGVVPLDADLVRSLREESEHLHHLVDDLGILALADAGELRMHPERIDAADLARSVVAAHQAAAANAGVRLSVHADEPAIIDVDPVRIRQALANLVGNAVRYTQRDGTVDVRVVQADDAVLLQVADNGPGIAPEHLPHVFDRFYRAEKSRSRATGGSGLGLAIAKQLVGANGGTTSVSSAEGSGSTFVIRVPAAGH